MSRAETRENVHDDSASILNVRMDMFRIRHRGLSDYAHAKPRAQCCRRGSSRQLTDLRATVTAVERRLGSRAWIATARLVMGLLAMAAVGAAALLLAAVEERLLGQPLIEPLVLALLLGVVVRNVARPLWVTVLNPGATLASKQILEVGAALLGASVSFPTLLAAGPALFVLVMGGVAGTLAIGFALGRLLALPVKLSVLVAVGNAICGNSAIAAVAPVIRADKKDVASSIALTAVIGIWLVLGLPLLIVPLTLDHYQYGGWPV